MASRTTSVNEPDIAPADPIESPPVIFEEEDNDATADFLAISEDRAFQEAQQRGLAYNAAMEAEAAGNATPEGEAPAETPVDTEVDPETDEPNPINRVAELKQEQTYLEQFPAGLVQGFNEASRNLESGAESLEELTDIPNFRVQFMNKEGEFILPKLVNTEEAKKLIEEGVPDFTEVPEYEAADTEGKKAVRDIVSFMAKFLLTRKVLPGGGSKVTEIARDSVAGGIADFTGDPDAPGLAELLEDTSVEWLIEPLLNQPEDSDFTKQVKNAMEGMGFGGIFDSFFTVGKVAAKKLLSKAPAVEEEALEVSDEAFALLGKVSEDSSGPIITAGRKAGVTAEELVAAGAVQVDKGTYINFAKIDTAEDVKSVLEAMTKKSSKGIDKARRGKITQEETKALADILGMDVEQLMKRKRGVAFNAEQAVAARRLLVASGEKLTSMAKLVAEGGTDADLVSFRRMVATHQGIQSEVLGMQAEAGRALASFKIPVSGKGRADAIQDILAQSGGQKVSRALAKRLTQLDSPGAVSAALKRGWKANTINAVKESFVVGLLWTPSTHIVNFIGNTAAIGSTLINRRTAEAYSKFVGGADGVAEGETRAMIHALRQGWLDTFRHSAKTAVDAAEEIGGVSRFKAEAGESAGAISAQAFGKEGTKFGQALDLVGAAVRAPTKLLTASDELFKSVNFRMEVHAQAWRRAAAEGLEGDEFSKRVADLTNNPPKDIVWEGENLALHNSFQNKVGGFGKWVANTRGTFGIAGVAMLPFARTPINLFRYSFENSPLAPFVGQWREDFAAGGAKKQIAMAKFTTGTGVAAVALDLTQAGYVTGGGPTSKERGAKQSLERMGVKNYSVRVGDQTISINKFDPIIATTFGVAADLYDIAERFDFPEDDEIVSLFDGFIIASARLASNKSYLRSVGDFAELVTTDNEAKQATLIGKLGGGLVPFSTALASIERIEDPEMRETMLWYEHVQARLPALSANLNPKRDLWGKERVTPGGRLGPLQPTTVTEIDSSTIDREMFKHRVFALEIPWRGVDFDGVSVDFSMEGGKFRKVLDEYRVLAGNAYKSPVDGMGAFDRLNAMVEGKHPWLSTIYDLRTDGEGGGKASLIQKEISRFRKSARDEILNNPKYTDRKDFREFRKFIQEKRALKPGKYIGVPTVQ